MITNLDRFGLQRFSLGSFFCVKDCALLFLFIVSSHYLPMLYSFLIAMLSSSMENWIAIGSNLIHVRCVRFVRPNCDKLWIKNFFFHLISLLNLDYNIREYQIGWSTKNSVEGKELKKQRPFDRWSRSENDAADFFHFPSLCGEPTNDEDLQFKTLNLSKRVSNWACSVRRCLRNRNNWNTSHPTINFTSIQSMKFILFLSSFHFYSNY